MGPARTNGPLFLVSASNRYHFLIIQKKLFLASNQFVYHDYPPYGVIPPTHASYTPRSVPRDISANTYDLRQYSISRPSSARSHREETLVPAPSYFASTHVPCADDITSPIATYPPQYDSYQVPQQISYFHPTTVSGYQNMAFPALSYNELASYHQPPCGQAQHNVPAQINMGQQSRGVCIGLPREKAHHRSGTSRYGYAEPVNPAARPKRKKATPAQVETLERAYQRCAFPSTVEREELAMELGMSPRSVQIWCVGFQSFGWVFVLK